MYEYVRWPVIRLAAVVACKPLFRPLLAYCIPLYPVPSSPESQKNTVSPIALCTISSAKAQRHHSSECRHCTPHQQQHCTHGGSRLQGKQLARTTLLNTVIRKPEQKISIYHKNDVTRQREAAECHGPRPRHARLMARLVYPRRRHVTWIITVVSTDRHRTDRGAPRRCATAHWYCTCVV